MLLRIGRPLQVAPRLTPGRALLLALLLFTGLASAQQLATIPPLTGPLVDRARLLTPDQAARLSQRLLQFSEAHGSQIVVLIVPTTRPEAIAQYSIRVFDAWKLGRKQYNDGILIVVAVQDREVRLDTGYGLEGAIPDAIAKRIVADVMVPRFRVGDAYGALTSGVDQIEKLIDGEKLPPVPSGSQAYGTQDGLGQFLIIGLVVASIIGGVLSLILGRFFGGMATGGIIGVIAWFISGSLFAAVAGAVIVFLFVLVGGGRRSFSRYGGYHGGGFGGGSFGGGGGSAGGGGASGRW